MFVGMIHSLMVGFILITVFFYFFIFFNQFQLKKTFELKTAGRGLDHGNNCKQPMLQVFAAVQHRLL